MPQRVLTTMRRTGVKPKVLAVGFRCGRLLTFYAVELFLPSRTQYDIGPGLRSAVLNYSPLETVLIFVLFVRVRGINSTAKTFESFTFLFRLRRHVLRCE